MENAPEYRHTTIVVDGRCLDLLLTEDEIAASFERCLSENNQKFINQDHCCSCWPVNMPPECPFWKRIMGMCRECDQ
jgi:hypothetical protein